MKKYLSPKLMLIVFLLFGAASIGRAQNRPISPTRVCTFTDFLQRVSTQNLPYIAEQYHVRLADAELMAAGIFPDPSLMVEGKLSDFSIGAGYTLELGGKRQARQRLAQRKMEYENTALKAYFQNLRADAAACYLDALLQQELLAVKRKAYSYMLQLSRSDSIRFILGDLAETDARQSKLEATTLGNAVVEQEGVYQSALIVLNQFMGSVTDSIAVPQGTLGIQIPAYNLIDLLAIGLENRQDLAAAHKQIDVANQAEALVRAARKIDLSLSVNYEQEPRAFVPMTHAVKVGLAMPIKLSNRNRGHLYAAQYAVAQAKVEAKSSALQIQAEISQCYYQFEAQHKIMQQYKLGLLSDAQHVMEGMIYKYKRGETGIMELLLAQRTFNEVQQQYLETRKAYALALVNLQKSCGIWDIDF